MNSTPRERTAAFQWARATPPPSSPRGKMECHTSLLEALETRFDDVDRAMARKPGAAYVRTHCGLGDARRYAHKPSERVEFARGAQIGGVSSGTIPKSKTVECRLDVRMERTRGARVDVYGDESVPVSD